MSIHAPMPPADRPCRMDERIRLFDWSATPLGAMDGWSERLRIAVDLCLRSALPTALYWGPERIVLHNDAWEALVGGGDSIGQPADSASGALWPMVASLVDQVVRTGQGAFVKEQPLTLSRGGIDEESWWNCHLLPLPAADGGVAGVLNQANEVSRTVTAERRISFQVQLADTLRGACKPEQAKDLATRLLGEHLGAARVGYAEVDEAQGAAWVRSDWTADPAVISLAGVRADLSSFGEEALAFLRSGEVLALSDIRTLATGSPDGPAVWEAVGMRALITVPLVEDGELKALLYVHEPHPRTWKRSEAAMARDVAERTWATVERVRAEQSLRESEDHYRHTVELNPQVTWTALPDGQLNRVSQRWQDWTGTTGLGTTWAEGLHPADRNATFAAWGHSVGTGEPYDIEHRVKMLDGSFRWARSRAFPRAGKDGTIQLWYGSTEDIHERRQAEEHQRLLINELNHRVKNTLASVQAIAFQTLKGDIPLVEARHRFEARLMALSRAHNLLTEQNWERACLSRVVRDATEHLSGDRERFVIDDGGLVWLAPRAALALALALHELGTNAAKHGALADERGTVAISWHTDGDLLHLVWKERDGPPVVVPERRGFGSRLIEQGLESDLGGTARLAFEEGGLRCTIAASLEAVQPREAELG
jgi:PAS domain S-box-containing protein